MSRVLNQPILLAVTLLLTPLLTFAAANHSIDSIAKQFMQKNHVSGLSIAIINGSTLTTHNYGYANELTKTKTNDNTIYSVASFSKTFTGTLVAIAQVENKLNLNKPFSNYIPALKNNTNLDNITVKMLITHTGSLPFNLNPPPDNFNQAVKQLKNFTPVYTPGTKYSYSNLSIGLNGYILENIYQQSYESLLYTKISQRLGLTSTYLELPNKLVPLVALGHENNQLRPYQKNSDLWYAAASLKSNIVDMGKYLQAHINYTQLNDKTLTQAIELIHQNYYCFENAPACEQLSWQAHAKSQLTSSIEDSNFIGIDKQGNYNFAKIPVTTKNTLKNQAIFIDKSCGGYGMSGYMAYNPVKKVGVVILLNKSLGQERIRLGRDILMELASTPYKD
jgi:CubicO group peptidase (beta-lactamase class C family)